MTSLGQAVFYLLGDRTKLDATMAGAERDTISSVSRVNGFLKGAFQVAVGGFMQQGIGTLFSTIKQGAFGMNATLETTTIQFETLMGSATQAEAHVKDLFAFAKDTPFETGPIIEASRTLRVAGGAALDTRDNLRMLGDAAAATSAPINEVSRWTGRLYAALQGGRPFGEASENLSRLAIISPQVRTQMESMQKAGASADEIWKVFTDTLSKFDGAMLKQAGTWTGLTSSIKDSLGILSATAAKPLFDVAKLGLKGFLDLLSRPETTQFAEKIAAGLDKLLGRMIMFGRNMIAMGQAIYGYGLNIGSQLSKGISASVSYVVNSLKAIGSVITRWLKPGSPPLITPDLDKWGTQAANVYMDGWRNADYSVFNEMGGQIKSHLDRMVKMGSISEGEVIPRLLVGRRGVAKLISEITSVGTVSEDTMRDIESAVGPAAGEIIQLAENYGDLARATDEVTAAQEDLNRVVGEYEDKLRPMNAELAQVKEAKDDIKDQQKLIELQATIADESTSAADRELAQLEMREILLEDQIDAVEDERDVAVDASGQKLIAAQVEQSAAEERMAITQRSLEQRSQENDLIADQTALLRQMAEAATQAASAGGGGGGAGGGGPNVPTIEEGVTEGLGAVEDKVNEKMSEIQRAMTEPITFAVADIQKSLNENTTHFKDWINGVTDTQTLLASFGFSEEQSAGIVTTIDSWKTTIDSFKDRFNATVGVVEAGMGIMQQTIEEHGPSMWESTTSAASSAKSVIEGALQGINQVYTDVFTEITAFMARNDAEISDDIANTWNGIMNIVEVAGEFVGTVIRKATEIWSGYISEYGTNIQLAMDAAWDIVMGIVEIALGTIEGIIQTTTDLMNGNWKGAWETMETTTNTITEGLKRVIGGALDFIFAIFGTTTADVEKNWTTWLEGMKTTLDTNVEGIEKAVDDAWANLLGYFKIGAGNIKTDWDKFVAGASKMGGDLINGISQGISDGISGLAAKAAEAGNAALKAAKDAILARSPSQRARWEVGRPISQGIALGILDGIDLVMNAAHKLGDDLIAELVKIEQNMAGILGDMFARGLSQMIGSSQTRQANNDFLSGLLFSASDIEAKRKQLEDALGDMRDISHLDPEFEQVDMLEDAYKELDKEREKIGNSYDKDIERLRDMQVEYFSEEERLELEAARAQAIADLESKKASEQDIISKQMDAVLAEVDSVMARIDAEKARVEQEFQGAVAGGMLLWAAAGQAAYEKVRDQLAEARAEYERMAAVDRDAAEAKYALQSKYIMDMAKLESELALATSEQAKQLIRDQMEYRRFEYDQSLKLAQHQSNEERVAERDRLRKELTKPIDDATRERDQLLAQIAKLDANDPEDKKEIEEKQKRIEGLNSYLVSLNAMLAEFDRKYSEAFAGGGAFGGVNVPVPELVRMPITQPSPVPIGGTGGEEGRLSRGSVPQVINNYYITTSAEIDPDMANGWISRNSSKGVR